MMKLCPKWLFSRAYSDACPVLLLKHLYNAEYTVSLKWHTVFEIKSVLLLSAIEIIHGNYSTEILTQYCRWPMEANLKMSI